MQAVVGALRAVLGLDSVAFEKGATAAEKRLGSLEKSFNQFSKNVGGAVSSLNGALASIGVGLSLGALSAFHNNIVKTIGGLGELADQLGLTATQLQAYQFAALQAGVKQEELEAAFIKFNATLGSAAAKDKTAIAFFEKIGVKILDVNGKLRNNVVLWDESTKSINGFGSAAEKTILLKEGMGRAAARLLPALADLSKGVDKLTEDATKAGFVVSDKTIKALDAAGDRAMVLRKRFEATFATEVSLPFVESLATMSEWFNKLIGQAGSLKESLAFWATLGLINPIALGAAGIVKAGTPKQTFPAAPSGLADDTHGPNAVFSKGVANPVPTNKGAAETFAKLIEKMKLEAVALQQQLAMMKADTNTPWPEFQKQMESMARVEKQIADFRAKEGLDEKHPKVAEFAFRANALEKERRAIQEHSVAAQNAEQIERQWGDGTRQLAIFQTELNAALATGRVTIDAAKLSMDEMTRSTDLQRLRMIGLRNEGWGGFVAGMQTARMEWDRMNNSFAQGQRFFESSISHMQDALSQFVATGKLSFRSLADSIIQDLIRMQLKAAATGLFGVLGKVFGNIIGNITAAAGLPTSGGVGKRAIGGPVLAGMPYVVGEKGPELLVPSRAGQIIPNDALGGGGMSVSQTFIVNGGDEAGVYRALNRVMPQMKKEVLDAVQDARSRGGKFSQTFRQ